MDELLGRGLMRGRTGSIGVWTAFGRRVTGSVPPRQHLVRQRTAASPPRRKGVAYLVGMPRAMLRKLEVEPLELS
jgi:hypothetical protein